MSATAFLYALEKFVRSDCEDVKISQNPGDRNRIDSNRDCNVDELRGQVFALVAKALCDKKNESRRDGLRYYENNTERLSYEIKASFLASHKQDIPDDEIALLETTRDRSMRYSY